MVAAERDDSRESLAILGWPFLVRVCGRGAGEDGVVAFFDLMKGPSIVVSSDCISASFSSCHLIST